MKKFSPLLALIILTAIGIRLQLSVQPASSNFLAVTNTPAELSPTPLPTEAFTATPDPTNTPTPSPSATPTATATQPGNSNPTQTGSGLPALGNGQLHSSVTSLASPVIRIVIPTLGLDTPVIGVPYQNTDWDITNLGASVGWLEGTSNPWANFNTILVGHLNLHGGIAGPFENLEKLKTGAKIYIYTHANVYTYRVSKNLVVKMTDTSVLDPNSHSQLTLITCNSLSWDPINDIYLLRQVVVAKLLAVEDLDSDQRGDRLTFRPQRK